MSFMFKVTHVTHVPVVFGLWKLVGVVGVSKAKPRGGSVLEDQSDLKGGANEDLKLTAALMCVLRNIVFSFYILYCI